MSIVWTNKQPGIESLLDSRLAFHSLPSIKRKTIGDLGVLTLAMDAIRLG